MPNRIEREIEEILDRLEATAPPRRPVRLRRSWRSRVSRFASRGRAQLPVLPSLNPGNLMLTGLGLIFAGLLLGMVLPELTRWAVIVGLMLFFTSFVLSFSRGRRGPTGGDTYWRGQRIPRAQLRGPTLTARLRAWWRRRNRRRW